ncbi:hypothetical protein [Ferrimicrobium acidiphilum]|nr:hypothetical protein [Ferrimicrobium acidiphilum]
MGQLKPRAGFRYPRPEGEFRSWFDADMARLDYLEWHRRLEGFVCDACG